MLCLLGSCYLCCSLHYLNFVFGNTAAFHIKSPVQSSLKQLFSKSWSCSVVLFVAAICFCLSLMAGACSCRTLMAAWIATNWQMWSPSQLNLNFNPSHPKIPSGRLLQPKQRSFSLCRLSSFNLIEVILSFMAISWHAFNTIFILLLLVEVAKGLLNVFRGSYSCMRALHSSRQIQKLPMWRHKCGCHLTQEKVSAH